MARVLEGLAPERVFYYFEQIAGIPHVSGNVKKIANYLVFFAKLHKLEWERDAADNVIIRKEATPGYEKAPTVILQGHTDMVPDRGPDCTVQLGTDGLQLETDGETVWAKGTTLGGDDGIAVAMMLAILESDEIAHPALEAVFTSDEEIGLLGAKALDCSRLKGRMLLNLDSEDEGVLTVSCAGGSVTTVTLPFADKSEGGLADCGGIKSSVGFSGEKKTCTVHIAGLTGGHSGAEIHKGRANAAILAGELIRLTGSDVIRIEGGNADNAIMPSCEMTVCGYNIPETAKAYERELASRYPEEAIRISCEEAPAAAASGFPLEGFLADAPYGVQSMSKEINGLVQTSLNLGILRTEGNAFVLTYSVRSSVEREKNELNAKLHALAEEYGGTAVTSGEYPAWEYRKDSPLREQMVETFERLYGYKPKVEAIHAGLECGLFAGSMPGLDAVSYGPDMKNIHTYKESLSVASVERTYAYTLALLRDLGQPEE